jgi:hypothetical protein
MSLVDCETKGYYATLELQYGCTKEHVHEAFARLAKDLNPDGNIKDRQTATRFQQLLTAYEVLQDDTARAGYDRVLQLRHYLQQSFDVSAPLYPHMIFTLHKINENNVVQNRLLKFDFIKREFSNWDKDRLKTVHKFSDIKSVSTDVSGRATEVIIHFKTYPRPYRYRAATMREKATLSAILMGILENKLQIVDDDAILPMCSQLKDTLLKRGSSGLWNRRCVLMGRSNVLIFKNAKLVDLVSCINLVPGDVRIDCGMTEANTFILMGKEQAITFRTDTLEQFQTWVGALSDVLEDKPLDEEVKQRTISESVMPYDSAAFFRKTSSASSKSGGTDPDESKLDEAINPGPDNLHFEPSSSEEFRADLRAQLALDGGDVRQTLCRIEYNIAVKKKELEDLANMEKVLRKELFSKNRGSVYQSAKRIGGFFQKDPEIIFV